MATQTKNMARLLRIMARLRGPDGCPWDREQTHQSIRHNLIEECYETLDALDAGQMDAFKDELGDLLLQVVFHAQMASEAGTFDFDGVAKSICEKLVRRHPHVFGTKRARNSAEVLKQWEAIKKSEKNARSIVPPRRSAEAPPCPAQGRQGPTQSCSRRFRLEERQRRRRQGRRGIARIAGRLGFRAIASSSRKNSGICCLPPSISPALRTCKRKNCSTAQSPNSWDASSKSRRLSTPAVAALKIARWRNSTRFGNPPNTADAAPAPLPAEQRSANYVAQSSCSQWHSSIVHALAAHASPQKTRLPRRTAASGFTVQTQLAQAHLTRCDRFGEGFDFALFFMNSPCLLIEHTANGISSATHRIAYAAAMPW